MASSPLVDQHIDFSMQEDKFVELAPTRQRRTPVSTAEDNHLKTVRMCYNAFGDPADPCLLLIQGLGTSLLGYSHQFVQNFVNAHYYVVRFDNRDVGRSTHFAPPGEHGIHALIRLARLGLPEWASLGERLSYTLDDMMEDAAGLLEHVLAEKNKLAKVVSDDDGAVFQPSTRAHLFGMSMGGMIAQLLAIHYPERVLSLNLMMTHVGGKDVAHPGLLTYLHLLRAPANSKEQYAQNMIAFIDFLSAGSYRDPSSDDEDDEDNSAAENSTALAAGKAAAAAKGQKLTPSQKGDIMREELRQYLIKGCERDGFHVAVDRQAAAVIRAPSRLAQLRDLNTACYPPESQGDDNGSDSSDTAATQRRHIPTLVVHGRKDPLIPVCNGFNLAAAIKGARLVIYPQLGHDFPPQLYKSFANEILLNMSKAPERK